MRRECISLTCFTPLQASTVSPTDCSIRQGNWKGSAIPLPNCPGVDIVGKVYCIDKQCALRTKLRIGDRVTALTKYGGNSRYLAIDADQLVRVPDRTDPAEATCFPETYLTAFQALHYGQSGNLRYRANALRGKTILLLGPLTTTLIAAFGQLSVIAGARYIYSPAKARHFEKIESMGIVPLSEDPLDWFESLMGRVDLIISVNEEVIPMNQKLLSRSGEIVVVTQDGNILPKRESNERLGRVVCSRASAQNKSRTHTLNVYNEWEENLANSKRDLAHIIGYLEERLVVPNVIERIPLNKVSRAHEILERKNVPGFVVCEPWLVSKSRAVML